MNKQKLLDQITADIVKNNVCPDLAKAATNIVPGEGNPDAKVMFIGEGPGKNEDLTGRPFVGAAGKFLDQLLHGVGLTRSDVFITSILKYRTPNNRDPLPAEKAAFLPYLLRQIAVLKPILLVPLGRHGMEHFLPGAKIGQVHGKLHHFGSQAVLPLFHPAAALYSSDLRATIEQDFKSIPNILSKLERKPTK